ncbi:thioredoxin [Halosquirtibacter xylanolyticus]|nr:thioredoxin [Prolixibacteraceae bacterium]
MNNELFKEKVFNYDKKSEWEFQGDKPAVIDFYADWCSPCKMIAPILEQLSDDYKDKIDIYKVDTEQEQELSAVFGIRSIPTLVFAPMKGKPIIQAGAMDRRALVELIERIMKP